MCMFTHVTQKVNICSYAIRIKFRWFVLDTEVDVSCLDIQDILTYILPLRCNISDGKL